MTDALIIGSGINSLACAMVLQAKGWRVNILERAAEPGGAVKSGAYTEDGFTHDWAAMNLSLFAGSPFFQEFGETLSAEGLEFAPASRCFASTFPDGRWLGIGNDRAANEAAVAGYSPADGEAWSALSDGFFGRAEHIFAILGSPFTRKKVMGNLWRLWRKEGLGGSLDLGRFLSSSSRVWLDETFENDHVKSTLAAWGMHLDFAPDISGGAMFPYLEAMANQAFGMVIGKGGADTITKAMIAAIEKNGGEVTCDAEVQSILTEGSKAKGVVLADGREIMASRAVIANVAPPALSRMISGQDAYSEKLNKFRHAPGTMMIHLAMDDLPKWSASEELREFAYVHLAPSMDQMARTYQQAQAGLLPDEPVIVVGQPTAIDSSRAPDGKHVLWLQVRMVPGQIIGDAKGQIAASDWSEAAEPMTERALDILERYAPGTKASIRSKRVVNPEELQADNPNLVGGDQLCGSHHLTQHFLFRPSRGHSDGSTPIEGLFHTGAAVWPGAGTGAGPGFLLGKKLTA